MDTRIEEYTVGQLAKAARISVRTLHHYDAIGLLTPAHVAANGYRLYRRAEAERLQDILFYRATGMDLAQIKALLDAPGDRLARLLAHRDRLATQAQSLDQMITTLDRTIANLKGDVPMAIEDLYAPFSPENQADYEAWLVDSYGPDMAKAVAHARADGLAEPMQTAPEAMATLARIEAALVAAMEVGQSGPALDGLLDQHRDWVAQMWRAPCDREAYGGLAEIYLAHPDFIARFETLGEGFSQWLTRAMKAYAARGAASGEG